MRLPVHIWIREENASSEEFAGYFIELARRLDACPRKMRLVVESTVPASLDFDPADGNLVACVCGRAAKFDLRHRWLPEHPVPLEFGRRPTVLLVDPAEGNRFRVRSRRAFPLPRWAFAVLAASASVAAVTLHPAAISAAVVILAAILAAAVLYR